LEESEKGGGDVQLLFVWLISMLLLGRCQWERGSKPESRK